MLSAARIAASASAERCSALPCPYGCPVSAGRTATPTAKNVSSAATRSVPECSASEIRPRLPVARPVLILMPTSAAAATTETSAVRRCGVMRRNLERFQRPDHDVLTLGVMEERLALERHGSHRVLADLRLRGLQRPRWVVDPGAMHVVLVQRVKAVALRQEVLERPRDGRRDRSVGAIRRTERRAATAAAVHDLVAAPLGPHARTKVREVVRPLRRLDRERALGVEAEEPDAGLVVDRRVRTDVELEEARQHGDGRQPANAEARDAKRRDPDPRRAVERVDGDRLGNDRAEHLFVDPPVREVQMVPRLCLHPRLVGDGPGAVRGVLEDAGLTHRRLEEVREAQYQRPRRKPPKSSPSRIRMMPRIVLYVISTTIPMMTRIAPMPMATNYRVAPARARSPRRAL